MLVNAWLLAVPVALATTASLEASPVAKVVGLLEDMQAALQEEEKHDEENYEKLQCWCSTNEKEKTEAIASGESAVEQLTSEIEQRTAKKGALGDDVKAAAADANRLLESIDSADAQRVKEGTANQARIIELTKNIGSLKGAVTVLKKHQATAFPQLHLGFLERSAVTGPSLGSLSAWMAEQHLEPTQESQAEVAAYFAKQQKAPQTYGGYSTAELSTLATARKLVRAFAQVSGSGEIFGVLTTMVEQMEEDLSELEKDEAKAKADFAGMQEEQKATLAQVEGTEKRKLAQGAENAKALADAKASLEDTEANLDADRTYLKSVREQCSQADETWEERKKTRTDEIEAVGEAINILTSDDAKDSLGATFSKGASFLQLQARHARTNVRLLAAKVLQKAARSSRSSTLMALSASVQLDAFVKVKQAINDMIDDLGRQQADEVKQKDFCKGELHTNEMDTHDGSNVKKDLEAKIALLEEKRGTLVSDKEAAQAALTDLKVELQRAGMDRVSENTEFQQTIADQRAAAAVMEKALVRLEQFYGRRESFAQRARASQTPPVTIEPYKKSSGASPVLVMLEGLVDDAKALEKEATKAESDAQAAYETFVAESNASMDAKARQLVDLAKRAAEAEGQQVTAQEDRDSAVANLEELATYAESLHKSCDFVLEHFDTRQNARQGEVDALKQALAILSGA